MILIANYLIYLLLKIPNKETQAVSWFSAWVWLVVVPGRWQISLLCFHILQTIPIQYLIVIEGNQDWSIRWVGVLNQDSWFSAWVGLVVRPGRWLCPPKADQLLRSPCALFNVNTSISLLHNRASTFLGVLLNLSEYNVLIHCAFCILLCALCIVHCALHAGVRVHGKDGLGGQVPNLCLIIKQPII